MTKSDEWWASLTIAQKERIAFKIVSKQQEDGPRPSVTYPACSTIWMSLLEDHKQLIMEHCTDAHGFVIDDWTEGHTVSY